MQFQGDAPEGSDTFQWPVIERDRVDGLRLIIWDKVKVPLCHYRVMHRKRVTSELHDSYFRLITIKHSISKIEWASNDYITQMSSTSQLSCELSSSSSIPLADLGRIWNRYLLTMLTWNRRDSPPLSAAPRAPKGDQGWIFWSHKSLSGLPESGPYRIFVYCP